MKKAFFKILFAIVGGAAMTSCLNDDTQPLDPSGAKNVIEFADISIPTSPSGSMYPVYSTAFAVAPQGNFEAIISYSGPNENNQDIVVNVAVDPVALQAYNQQMRQDLHGVEYDLLPAQNYSITSLTYTIPAGATKVSVPITVYPDKFDLTKRFAIPLRIVSASAGILSSNFSVAILNTVAKNQYDARYKANIQMKGWNYAPVNISDVAEDYPDNIGLVTTGPNTVTLTNYLRGGEDLQPGFAKNADGSTSATGFGVASPQFTFDATGKLTQVTNINPNKVSDGRGREFVINTNAPAGHNQFNAVDRSVTLNYFFKQNGRPDNNVIMKLTFRGER